MSRWNVMVKEKEEELSGVEAEVGADVDPRCVMGSVVGLD